MGTSVDALAAKTDQESATIITAGFRRSCPLGESTMKHIVLCSDGTDNTAIKGRGTNVFKLFEAVDVIGHKDHAHQYERAMKVLLSALADAGSGYWY